MERAVLKLVGIAAALATGCQGQVWVGNIAGDGGGSSSPPSLGSVTSTMPSVASGSLAMALAQKGVNAPNQITLVMSNLANLPNVCAFADSASGNVANLVGLAVILGSRTDPHDVVGPGTYTAGDHLGAVIIPNDSACKVGQEQPATAATLRVDSVTSGSINGSFDLTFATGHLSGTFDAPFCDSDGGSNGPPPDGGPACLVYPACGAPDSNVCLR